MVWTLTIVGHSCASFTVSCSCVEKLRFYTKALTRESPLVSCVMPSQYNCTAKEKYETATEPSGQMVEWKRKGKKKSVKLHGKSVATSTLFKNRRLLNVMTSWANERRVT